MNVVALLRDAGGSPHSVVDTLTDHLQVVWGALVALAVVVLLTPAVGGMARLLGVVDTPGGRRVNRNPVPRLGGLALFLGILVPSLAFLPFDRETRGILLGAAVAVTVGAIDDFHGLRWFEKLAGQVLAAAIPTGFGIWVDRFTFPFLGVHALPAAVGVPLTILWIVAIMNMVNLLDGLDGLAAGVAGIAGLTFAIIALSLAKTDAAILSAVVFGACLGFLRHNFYPARIFMGDSGALLLGFVLATISVQGLLKTAATVALFFPLLVLAVPIVDTTFVVLRRLKHGQKVFEGDQAHLHHRFLRRGFSQPRAAFTIWGWCTVQAAAALATRFVPFRAHGVWHFWPTVVIGVIALAAIGFSVYVVYLLEIVKIANPIQRRRPADDPLRKRDVA
jgi:UDP-GlcNAc:undecaprenyl-phosphate GlcNAc-1-phosphate transferase